MAFQRQSMETILAKMTSWTQGVSTQLTDFRVGSRIRTIYEAVALVMEEQYDRIFRALRQLIEDNIYSIFGFDKIPAVYATGNVTLGRATPADQSYFIPAGTTVMSAATQYVAPIKFYTVQDAVLAIGTTSVDVPVVCSIAGLIGNISAGAICTFLQKPAGVDTVTNAGAFSNGAEEESKDSQKERFNQFIDAQSRGMLQAIEYGAKTATVVDSVSGEVTERVIRAAALEDLPNRKGEVDLYIWNGIGTASADLITNVKKVLTGYYDSNGNPIYGYKAAGILVNVYSAPLKSAKIKLTITMESWATLDDSMKTQIEAAIDHYFGSLKLGETVVQSALESNIKVISGIYDVKLYLSLDGGTTWNTDNITTTSTQMAAVTKPIIYA